VAGLMFLFFALSPVKKKLFLKCALLILFIVIIYVQVCSMFPSGHFFFQLPRLAEERFASIFRPSEEITALTRFSEWSAALAKIKQHPIIGNGLGTKVSFIAYDEYRNPVRVSNYLHNSYLFFLLNTGIAGLLAILWLSIAFILYGLKVYRRTAKPYYKALALGCVTAYVSLFTTSFIGPELSFPGRTIVVGFLMGAVALIDKTGSNKPI